MARIYAAAISVSLLWGSGWLFIKLGLSSFPPFLFSGARGALAGLLLLGLARLSGEERVGWAHVRPMLAIGLLMTGVSNGLVYWGQQHVSSSVAALVWCGMPFFTAAFSHIVLPEHRMNAWQLIGLVIGFAGVWLVLSSHPVDLSAGANEGKLAIVVGSIIWAFGLVISKRLLPPVPDATSTGIQLAAGAILLLPLGMLTENAASISITPLSVFVFLMMLLGQGCIAYLCYYYLIARVSPTQVALLSFVTPTIAVILGVLLLGEPVSWQLLAGLVAVGAGILAVNILGQREHVTS